MLHQVQLRCRWSVCEISFASCVSHVSMLTQATSHGTTRSHLYTAAYPLHVVSELYLMHAWDRFYWTPTAFVNPCSFSNPCFTVQFMVAYQLLMSIGVNVTLLIDGSEFSVVQVSSQPSPLISDCWFLLPVTTGFQPLPELQLCWRCSLVGHVMSLAWLLSCRLCVACV